MSPKIMSSEQSESGTLPAEEMEIAAEVPITLRLIGTAMLSGLIGMVLMLPVLVGVPVALDLFQTEPIVRFASFLGMEPSLEVGIALFVLGGTLFLPVQFLVVGAFLPPASPRYARGVSFGVIYWIGFLMAFWPGGGTLAVALFVMVSFLYHVFYGFTLGYLIDRWAEIPQHEV
jgi:hypothetical protein